MNRLSARRAMVSCGTAVTFGVGALAVSIGALAGGGIASANSCSQYIQPYDPYLQTCGIPNAPVTVPGASPGAGAIIACRNVPGCLSQVVNGPGIIRVPQPDTRPRQSP